MSTTNADAAIAVLLAVGSCVATQFLLPVFGSVVAAVSLCRRSLVARQTGHCHRSRCFHWMFKKKYKSFTKATLDVVRVEEVLPTGCARRSTRVSALDVVEEEVQEFH